MNARPPARGQLVEHVLVIEGDWPHIAGVLASMDMVTVMSTTESHVLFTLPSGAAAVARPDEHDLHVEVIVKDATGGIATRVLATKLREVLDVEVRLQPEPA